MGCQQIQNALVVSAPFAAASFFVTKTQLKQEADAYETWCLF